MTRWNTKTLNSELSWSYWSHFLSSSNLTVQYQYWYLILYYMFYAFVLCLCTLFQSFIYLLYVCSDLLMALLLCFRCMSAGLFFSQARFLFRLFSGLSCSGIFFGELKARVRLRIKGNFVLIWAIFEGEPCWPLPLIFAAGLSSLRWNLKIGSHELCWWAPSGSLASAISWNWTSRAELTCSFGDCSFGIYSLRPAAWGRSRSSQGPADEGPSSAPSPPSPHAT